MLTNDVDALASLGQIAGVGGVALGVVLVIFRGVVAKALRVETELGYRLLRLTIILAFGVGVVGIGAYYLNETNESVDGDVVETHGEKSPAVVGTRGDVRIRIGRD